MISIRKYLNAGGPAQAGSAETSSGVTLSELCSRLLDAVAECALTGDERAEARNNIARARGMLHPELLPEESEEIRATVCTVLAEHKAATEEAATRAAVHMRRLAEMLNHALTVATAGGERSSGNLRKVQDALQKMSRMQDIFALKRSLADTIRTVDEDSKREKEAARELGDLQAEIGNVQTQVTISDHRLGGRKEGARKIEQEVRSAPPDHAVYAVAFSFDRLDAIVQRYGPDAVEDLMYRVIRERIQPLAPANSAYRWSPRSLVGVFQRPRDLAALREASADLNRSPLVHRVSLGNRTALLSLTPSHLVAEAKAETPNTILEEVDRFTGANA